MLELHLRTFRITIQRHVATKETQPHNQASSPGTRHLVPGDSTVGPR